MADFRFVIHARPLSVEGAYRFVRRADLGGVVIFLGTVRSPNQGKVVQRIEYSAFREMAETEFARIAKEASKKWKVGRIYIAHRIGRLRPGEPSVIVAVSSAHRAEAFSGARYSIDELKARAPIWKKEIYHRGQSWVANRP